MDLVAFTSAFSDWVKEKHDQPSIVIGRDGRISGEMVKQIVINTLIANGVDVIDLDYSTTPTVEMYVPKAGASAGIIITASHNNMEWNALKFLNDKGEFISSEDGKQILTQSEKGSFDFSAADQLGQVRTASDSIEYHIQQVLALPLVNAEQIRSQNYHVVVDCINSTGAIAIPPLLDALGVTYELLNAEINGTFAHNPEPLAAHLTGIMERVKGSLADMGIVVDPDVDRLAFISEDGSMFGEEYTLVAIADYVLSHTPGNTVSNLSSTQALKDVTHKYDCQYFASAVGEVNVVAKMKEVNAIIGGEGNGGIIYPEIHSGRDALVGIALMLSSLAASGKKMTDVRNALPSYEISKNKIQLTPEIDVDQILQHLIETNESWEIDTTDGVKFIAAGKWVHLRKSNTEPIIRIYSESSTIEEAEKLAEEVRQKVHEFVN